MAPATWVYPGGANAGHPIGATDTFPGSGTPTNLITGGDAVGQNMIGQLRSGGSTQALFGIMDSSTAAYFGLPTVSIKRADGSVTTSSTATITQALQDGTGNPDGTIAPNYATSDPNAWPMPMPLYALAPTNKVSADTGKTLAGFLGYVAGAGQAVLPNGYAPLTSAEIAQTTAAAAAIPTTAGGAGDAGNASGAGGLPGDAGFPGADNASGLGGVSADGLSGDHSSGAPGSGGQSGAGGPTAHSAIATGAQLALADGGFAALAPSIAGAAALCLLAGAVIEVASRIRRLRAARTDGRR